MNSIKKMTTQNLLVLSREWMGMGEWDYHSYLLWIIHDHSLDFAPVRRNQAEPEPPPNTNSPRHT